MVNRMKVEYCQPIGESKMLTKQIRKAQEKVELRNFEIRKHLLEYDDILNQQRIMVYDLRDKILEGSNIREEIFKMMRDVLEVYIENSFPYQKSLSPEEVEDFASWIKHQFDIELDVNELPLNTQDLIDYVYNILQQKYIDKVNMYSDEVMKEVERIVALEALDSKWRDHLVNLEALREGINLRAYGERNPLVEYKIEASGLFSEMMFRMKTQILEHLFKVQIDVPVKYEEEVSKKRRRRPTRTKHEELGQFETTRRRR